MAWYWWVTIGIGAFGSVWLLRMFIVLVVAPSVRGAIDRASRPDHRE